MSKTILVCGEYLRFHFMMYLILSSIKLRSIRGIAVELMPPDLEAVGSNYAGC